MAATDRDRLEAARRAGLASAASRAAVRAVGGNDDRRHRGGVATSDRLYDADEAEFLAAVERWKGATGNRFPTYSQLLGIARSLGYRKPPEEPCSS